MKAIKWATQEVELAKNDMNSYHKRCFEAALNAYTAPSEIKHNGVSWEIRGHILKRLIDNLPLTPITHSNAEWEAVEGNSTIFQTKRMPSLLKEETENGTIYKDSNRIKAIELSSGDSFVIPAINEWVNQHYPITFPYYPPCKYEFVVYFSDVTDGNNGFIGYCIERVLQNGKDLCIEPAIV